MAPVFRPMDVDPGKYHTEVTNGNYWIKGFKGKAKYASAFDLEKEDPNSPIFTSLKVFNSLDHSRESIQPGESARVEFSASNYIFIKDIEHEFSHWQYQRIALDSTRLFFKQNGSLEWQALHVTTLREDTSFAWTGRVPGMVYSADLSHATGRDSSAIDLKFYIEDQSGNSAEWVLQPAFVVGSGWQPTAVKEPVDQPLGQPMRFKLHQNHPNPFNASTVIPFALPRAEKVRIKIYDLLGREVKTLVQKQFTAGEHRIKWNGDDELGRVLPSGLYVVKLQAGNFVATGKVLLLR